MKNTSFLDSMFLFLSYTQSRSSHAAATITFAAARIISTSLGIRESQILFGRGESVSSEK